MKKMQADDQPGTTLRAEKQGGRYETNFTFLA